ncbi:hypothetical protein [Nonlabens ponticola]|uniref:DUF4149 domain-containing protein n=1 Tax=Nonlabens ponticola TaxID=2496866 RepID=A0A3S9MZ87_9FLAO|nr:hypothetical protein [Nonlabens ponticola]AZQ44571.1 hypothetical protein EJ995_10060 [Nonlabens ponticola]
MIELSLLELLKLSCDVGLVVLIWIVQLLIYPSFIYFAGDGLARWHTIYTRNITFIVLPLMLGQLLLSGWLLFGNADYTAVRIADFILVGSMWASTAFYYKPLHEKLQKEPHRKELCIELTTSNWWRVAVWTVILVLNFIVIW